MAKIGEDRARDWQDFVDHLRGARGHLAPDVRAAVVSGTDVPAGLAEFVRMVEQHAYRVTDAHLDALARAGYTEDQVYEATVLAAVGAADRRLRAALRAMAAT